MKYHGCMEYTQMSAACLCQVTLDEHTGEPHDAQRKKAICWHKILPNISFSFSLSAVVDGTKWHLLISYVITDVFVETEWLLSMFKSWLVCVGFLYTPVSSLPSSDRWTSTCRKWSEWSSSTSCVNWIIPYACELRCSRNFVRWRDWIYIITIIFFSIP